MNEHDLSNSEARNNPSDEQRKRRARAQQEKLLSDPQQLNSYAYAKNNPLAYVDPDGQLGIGITGGGAVEVGDIIAGTAGTASIGGVMYRFCHQPGGFFV